MHPTLQAGALALVCAGLVACATQPPRGGLSGPLTAEETFRRVCADRPNAHPLFVAYDAVRPVSADVRCTVRVANNLVAKTCANPPANLAEAAVTVTSAIRKIRRAIGRN